MSQCEKDQAKWYASTKIHSDMIMPRCKLVSLRSIANERVMPRYRAISEMTKLCCIPSQVSMSWSNHLKNLSTMRKRLCPINTSNKITHSYLILQCERNLITSKEQLCLKNHHRLRNMPLCKVHQMKYINHVSCSNMKNDVWYPPNNGHDSKIHHRLRGVCPSIMVI